MHYPIQLTTLFFVSLGLLAVSQADRGDNRSGQQESNLGDVITDTYKNCKDSKATCIGYPKDCIYSTNCKNLVSIKKYGTEKLRFSLLGSGQAEEGYVAVGVSKTGKNMVNTSIVACTADGQGQNIHVLWSKTKTAPESVHPDNYVTPSYNGLFEGKRFCEFDRDAKFYVEGLKFDLNNEKYAVLLAQGPLKRDGHLQYHGQERYLFEPMHLSSSGKEVISLFSLSMCMLVLFLFSN